MRTALLLLVVSSVAFGQAKFEMENGALKDAPITFKAGTAELAPESAAGLQHVADYLNAKDYITTLRIEAHVGDKVKKDAELTARRALAVAKALVAKGIDCKRLLPVGFGSTKPAFEDAAQNERVLFVNAALKGRAIGGLALDGFGQVAGDPCKK